MTIAEIFNRYDRGEYSYPEFVEMIREWEEAMAMAGVRPRDDRP